MAYIFFCLWSWRVPAKDDFIQTFCDNDLGKHRILFTQVVVNNMSHQSCIYDKWQSYPHKANLLIIGRKTEYRFTQTVHTGSEAGCSHWNGPRLQFHELNQKTSSLHKITPICHWKQANNVILFKIKQMKRITDKKIYHCYYWWISWPRQKPGVIQVGDYTKMKNHLYQLPMQNQYTITIIIM